MDILLIDDEAPIRDCLTDFLQERGHGVVGCASAEDAMSEYERLFYPLIVVDICLTGMDGIEFCTWVRDQPDGHRHIILVATGKSGPENMQQILAAGADDFIAKPFSPEMLNLRFAVAEQMVKQVAERNKLEKELQREKDFISAVVETAPVLIVVLDQEGYIRQFNRACRNLTGYSLEMVQGETFMEVFLSEEERAKFKLSVANPKLIVPQYLLESEWTQQDQTQRSISWSFTPVLKEQGGLAYIIGAGMDVTERKAAEERLAFLAERDPLTKCYNRSQLHSILQKAVEEAHAGLSTVLLYIDIDNFKVINDTLGHTTGNRVLISLVHILRLATSPENIIVRFGGDEFLIVLHETSLAQANQVAERIRFQINDYLFNEEGKKFNMSASIGLFKVEKNTNGEEVFALAESACYAAKARGRNRVASYEPDKGKNSQLIDDSVWWTCIKDAIRKQHLELWFQPIVNIVSGKVEFYESLVRFRDKQGGIVTPQHFLPSVERSGGITMLDRYVIELALDTLLKHPTATLSVNVSEKSVNDPAFVDYIVGAFSQNGISPGRVIFEIPENVVINLQRVWQMLDLMKTEGFRFALDDFGAGFCSISYLKHLPVEMLKIDGSFIKNLAQQTMNQALVRSINEMGHILRLITVAEFVEDVETLEMLRELGVDYAQGYLFGKPGPQLSCEPQILGIKNCGKTGRLGASPSASQNVVPPDNTASHH
jgi:diguanylate cyclase (GGDEF)-like protein/PAS domain S-box-containing protein